MNNSRIIQDASEEKVDVLPILREKATKLTDLIEAISNLEQSNYWKVLLEEYNTDLKKLVSRLEKEGESVEIYRLQGEIKGLRKLNLVKMLTEKRQELEIIKKKLNE